MPRRDWQKPLLVPGTGGFTVDKRRFRLERNLEDRCVEVAHDAGFLTRKMNGLGFSSWPDRLVIWPQWKARPSRDPASYHSARQEYVELKLPGEEPTKLQLKLHRMLRERGCVVHVCDNLEHWNAILKG